MMLMIELDGVGVGGGPGWRLMKVGPTSKFDVAKIHGKEGEINNKDEKR